MYNSFEFTFNEYPFRLYAWSSKYEISFSIGMTEMQVHTYNKMFNDGAKIMLINTMKSYIRGYIKYIENNNEFSNTKI